MLQILDVLMYRERRHAFYPRGLATAQQQTAW
jgi:hypothetical protein